MVTPLKRLLLERGMYQYDLAKLVGRSETRISRIVCGRTTPTSSEMAAIARALSIPQRDLFPSPEARSEQ